MLGWMMLGAAVVIMYKVADAEGRNGLFWGVITFLVCLGCAVLIPLPFISIAIGLALCYGAMFALKLMEK